MIIERNIAPYVVFAEDPILTALHKISANGQRIIFLVNESGSTVQAAMHFCGYRHAGRFNERSDGITDFCLRM
ncbi:MAG: hypothetical protein ACFNLE_02455 [Rothia aeria]